MPFHTRGSHQRQPLVQAQAGNKKNKASSPKSVRQLELTDLANSWSSLLAHEQRRYKERAGPLSAQRLAPRRHVLHPVSMRAGTLARPSRSTLPTPKPQLLQCPPHLRQSFQRARPPRHLHVGSDGQWHEAIPHCGRPVWAPKPFLLNLTLRPRKAIFPAQSTPSSTWP